MGLVAITGSKIVVRYAYGIRRKLRDDPPWRDPLKVARQVDKMVSLGRLRGL
jgi:hypothetical protein